MSERLIGPDLNSRLAYVPAGGALLSAAGMSAIVFANSTGSTLADIQIYNGTSVPAGPVPNSTLTVDSDSLIPLFWFPQNVDTVYIEVNGGTRTPANADYDFRVDNVSGFINSPMLSTGIVAGGTLTANVGNPIAVDISPLTGYIVDYATDQYNPAITPLRTTVTTTVVLSAESQARTLTWLMMDANGAIVQQGFRPSAVQRRTHLQIGAVVFIGGAVFLQRSLPVTLSQPVNYFFDMGYALGSFNVSGNVIGPNGVSLTFSKTAGNIFSLGFGHDSTPNNPNIFDLPFRAPTQHFRASRNNPSISVATALDVSNFDSNGVITPVGGGTNSSTNFRVFAFSAINEPEQIVVQYGQNVHSSLSAAVAALRSGTYIVNPDFFGVGALLGFISVTRTATNLSDPTQAVFTKAGKFDTP